MIKIPDTLFWKTVYKVDTSRVTRQQMIQISILPRKAFERMHLCFIKSDAAHAASE